MRAFFYADNRYLGEGTSTATLSYHFLCPHCGTVWARIVVDPSTHHALSHPCFNCPDRWGLVIPGVMFFEPRYHEIGWPYEALVRDVCIVKRRSESQILKEV